MLNFHQHFITNAPKVKIIVENQTFRVSKIVKILLKFVKNQQILTF